ncbi:DUF6457 domain-containing protein [Streptomyces albipurpureus]|uniref:DUF6457 domain-containing protein n=1 Tax=Streptomyces albipurpureus TaxID=2897419 RepID=A0ABT0UJT9_9ACTN|nr:DUF6457 domain-containing protein [Streptomyces sp. CWNU-1]MCM2388887.1 DUF6457 domain-containing protein [Streptomyces sp. CWNU-1]
MTATTGKTAFDAIVLAGGAAQRLGGADKPGLSVGGRTLLDRVLAACRDARRTVVVGGRRATERPVVWAQESPPGGGPVAALDAGLRQLAREPGRSAGGIRRTSGGNQVDAVGEGAHEVAEPGVVLVLSADLPFLREPTVHALIEALSAHGQGPEGVLLTDATGREQPLVAAYAAEPLRRELALLATEYGSLAGLSLRLLTRELDLQRMDGEPTASFDCDTWEDISAARARIREHGYVLDEWIAAVKDELDIELDVDISGLLDLARDAAHGVARPAAPLTTFLVGYAAASGAGGPQAVAEAARKAEALAKRWAEEAEQGAAGSSASADRTSATGGPGGPVQGAGPAGDSAPGTTTGAAQVDPGEASAG